jgi:hypothetical protein
MRRTTLCLAVAMLAAPVGDAAAKEIVAAKVCGASQCRQVDDERALAALSEGGPAAPGPKGVSGFYRAKLTVAGEGEDRFRFELAVVPAAGMLRAEDGTWMPVSETAAAQLRRVTRGLEPIPAAKLGSLAGPEPVEARVDEVVVADPDPSGSSPWWPWALGGAALVAGLLLLPVRRRRRGAGGSPKPAEG